MTIRNPAILPLLLTTCFLWLPPQTCFAKDSEQLRKPVTQAITIRQSTQKQEQQWRDEREKLLAQLDSLEEKKKQLTEHRAELNESIRMKRERIGLKQQQLADIEAIRDQITPLIGSLINDLQSFVAKDLPFLSEERTDRLQRLVELRDDPEVSVSEKFRKVLEAMLVETEYGNTIEVYQEMIDLDGQNILVNIFRLGRVGLFFQTLERKSCGMYNVAGDSYSILPDTYRPAITTAI